MVHRYGHWRLSSPARESCIAGRRWRPITNISISGQVLRTFMAKSFLNLAHRPGFKTIWPSRWHSSARFFDPAPGANRWQEVADRTA